MLENNEGGEQAAPKRDLHEIFDTNRTKLTSAMVDRFEHLHREADRVKNDMAELAAECSEQAFSKRDIKSMKKIAKWRMEDKRLAAVAEIESLRRIGSAAGFDLFDFAALNEGK